MAGEEIRLPVSTRRCFVIGPIGDPDTDVRHHADWFLDYIVKPVLEAEEFGFKVQRADDISAPGQISSQVIACIHEDDLVIADLTFHNPNAFYELAIRHVIGKPIVHMCRIDFKVPFDVGDYRTIKYSVLPKKIPEAQEELRKQIRAIRAPGYVVDNPVVTALGKRKLEASASPADQLVANLLERQERMEEQLSFLQGVLTAQPDHSNSIWEPTGLAPAGRNLLRTKPSNTWDRPDIDAILEKILGSDLKKSSPPSALE